MDTQRIPHPEDEDTAPRPAPRPSPMPERTPFTGNGPGAGGTHLVRPPHSRPDFVDDDPRLRVDEDPPAPQRPPQARPGPFEGPRR